MDDRPIVTTSDLAYDLIFISDGLTPEDARQRYHLRRQWLLDRLSHPLLLVGPSHGPSGTYPWAHIHRPIFQDAYLLYLTGINQSGVALWVDPRDRQVILFLPKKDPHLEFWEGARLGYGSADAARVTGLETVLDRRGLLPFVKSALGSRSLGVIWNTVKSKRRHDDSWRDIVPIQRVVGAGKLVNLAPLMWEQRLMIDVVDQENLRIANTKSADAYREFLAGLSRCESEQGAAALLEYGVAKRSPFGTSFPSIVAGGRNAAVLHYTKNNEPLLPGTMVLTDFGVRWHAMHADVTRTAPINGHYSPLQRILIDVVLGAQMTVATMARPGASIADLNEACWAFIASELDRTIVKKGGAVRLPYEKAPHNVSHLLGHQVHDGDPSREYRTRPLVAGNIISNEPGIYGEIELTLGGIRYHETLGIRIEDDLIITPDGCDNVTTCPKDPVEIERLIQ